MMSASSGPHLRAEAEPKDTEDEPHLISVKGFAVTFCVDRMATGRRNKGGALLDLLSHDVIMPCAIVF
jgi:hypothetical protein